MLFSERAIIRLESVDSTNNYAANLLRMSMVPEGTVITAQEQLSGKGQRGSYWESAAGENLLCTMVFYPTYLDSSNYFFLTKVIALALREVVAMNTDNDVFIKWPNDIIVRNRKIAGILVETAWNGNNIQSAIVGMGLNVNQTQFSTGKATSLKILNGTPADIDECLRQLIIQIEQYLYCLQSGQFADISRQYREHLFRLGQVSSFHRDGHVFDAMITGVDESGRLKLYTEKGESLTCSLKEIQFIL